MKYLVIAFLVFVLFSCSNSELEGLRVENQALKQDVEALMKQAEQEAANAREAEARALMAQQDAELAMVMAREAEAAAAKALKDCQGN